MTDGDTVAQLAVVVLLLVLAVPALATAHESAGTPLGYEETATVDYANDTTVSENATVEGYGDDVTVTVGGDELTSGVDYRWNATAGTIDWQDTNNTTSGDTATIRYQAFQRTAETALAWTIIAPLMSLFGLFALVAAVRTLLSTITEVWTLS